MPNKYTKFINPNTDDICFGVMPEIDNKLYFFPEGDIFLCHGEHRGANRGFGVKHIWAEHEKDISSLGYMTEESVANYVADILVNGAKIYCEFGSVRNEKVSIIQNTVGMAVLEHRYDRKNNSYYSVITAFPKKRPHGSLIGNL